MDKKNEPLVIHNDVCTNRSQFMTHETNFTFGQSENLLLSTFSIYSNLNEKHADLLTNMPMSIKKYDIYF